MSRTEHAENTEKSIELNVSKRSMAQTLLPLTQSFCRSERYPEKG